MARMKRRTFLKQSAGLGLALSAVPAWAHNVNERLNLGFIGLGGRGNELLKQFTRLNDVRVAALCDPDAALLADAAGGYPKAARYADLRELLNDADVDAVVIATCNHWHALAAILACQAGKDVYVEKPLSHSHWEGQQVVRAAHTLDRIVQVGTQQRSDPLQDELKEFLHGQQSLGPIRYVQVCRVGRREPIGKRAKPLEIPKSVDYNLWLGPAQDEPIFRDKLHYDWHWNWNTGNGELGNWGVHVLDDAVNVVLRDEEPFPKRIVAAGGRVAWDDAGNTPNAAFVCYETGATPVFFALSNLASPSKQGLNFSGVGSGYVVHCEGGYYAGGRGGGAAYDSSGAVIRKFDGDSGESHQRNFVDAVFAHEPSRLNAEVQIGHQSTAWCNLADIAIRSGYSYQHQQATASGQPSDTWAELVSMMERHLADEGVDVSRGLSLSPELEFDAATEQFVGEHAAEANRFLRREYRQPFKLPTIA